MTKTKRRTTVERMTEVKRLNELRAVIALCFGVLGDDLKEIANRTRLSVSTLYRLRAHASLDVRFRSVQNLAIAAGLRLEATECGYRLSVVD